MAPGSSPLMPMTLTDSGGLSTLKNLARIWDKETRMRGKQRPKGKGVPGALTGT